MYVFLISETLGIQMKVGSPRIEQLRGLPDYVKVSEQVKQVSTGIPVPRSSAPLWAYPIIGNVVLFLNRIVP